MTQPTLQDPVSATDEAQIVKTMYRAFNENNLDLVDEACAPDWQDIPMMPGQAPGPDGLKQLIPVLLKAFPDLQMVIHDMIVSPGRVAVRASIVGTHRGEIHGVAPTGKTVDVALYEFHHLKDRRITHTWHVEDWFGMLFQVGAWPPRPASEAK